MAEIEADAIRHTQRLKKELAVLTARIREDIEAVDEPQFRAMFETAAEVLRGLIQTLTDYEEKKEAAWKRS